MKHANELLNQAIETLAERGESYGSPDAMFNDVAKRWSLTLGVDVTAAQVITCMIELKLARLNNNTQHYDSIVDIAGYAALLNELNHYF